MGIGPARATVRSQGATGPDSALRRALAGAILGDTAVSETLSLAPHLGRYGVTSESLPRCRQGSHACAVQSMLLAAVLSMLAGSAGTPRFMNGMPGFLTTQRPLVLRAPDRWTCLPPPAAQPVGHLGQAMCVPGHGRTWAYISNEPCGGDAASTVDLSGVCRETNPRLEQGLTRKNHRVQSPDRPQFTQCCAHGHVA